MAILSAGYASYCNKTVATYSHDNEFEPEAVIELALPDPELRSRLIQNFKDF